MYKHSDARRTGCDGRAKSTSRITSSSSQYSTAEGYLRKFRPNIQLVAGSTSHGLLRLICGKGGSGARNLGFGEAIRASSSAFLPRRSRGAARGRTRFCASQPPILRFVRVVVALDSWESRLRTHPIGKNIV